MQKFNSKIDSEVSLDPIVLPHYALGIKIYDTILDDESSKESTILQKTITINNL